MVLEKLKEARVDPLNLQMRYWSDNLSYSISKKWFTDMYPNIKFVVKADIKPDQTGMLKSE